MSFLNRAESWSNILKNLVIIGGIVIAVLFLSISIYANATEDKLTGGVPKPPAIDKAAWEVKIANTGNVIYTNSWEQPDAGIYLLHGYYELNGGKYKRHKNDLALDEYFFGDIIIKKR
jgi:hypothetical protein